MPNKLSPADVAYILQAEGHDGEVAQRLGVSRQAVNAVRTGRAYAKVAPQLPRRDRAVVTGARDGPLCTTCDFWNEHGCSFSLPEAAQDLRFAQECSMYELHHKG